MRLFPSKLFSFACMAGLMVWSMAAFGYETPSDARYPYVSTYYVEPVVSPSSNTVIRFFATDWENSLERFGDDSFRFDAYLRYSTNRLDWTELSLTDIPSGDNAFDLGPLPRGDYVLGLRVVEKRSGLSSHTVWHEFRSRTAEELAVPADRIYTMTETDLATYGIVPESNRYAYIEVPVDSVCATNETLRANYVAEVARATGLAPGTYAIFSPTYNGKPILRAFRSMSCKYADDYDFNAVELEASNNVVAIQRFIDDVSAAGYRRLVFLPGKYRLSYHASLEMRNGLDIDLNGATLKGNGFTGSSGCIVNFTHVHDAALVNGTIEGDYYEHDYAGSPDNSEWPLGVCLHGDCRYVTLDGLVVSNITGYGVSNGTRAYDHTFAGSSGLVFSGSNNFTRADLNLADGSLDASAPNRYTSAFRDISKFTNGYVMVSKYLGYQGISTKSWYYKAAFYDADKNFIHGEVAFQYRHVLIPQGACFMRISVEAESFAEIQDCALRGQLFKVPWNCVYRNLRIYRCRCVGMAQSAMRNMLVENCEFSFSGESSATCAYDAEDGWDQMQDVFIRDNYFHDNWNAEFLTCAGHNFVIERNRGKIHLYARTNSPCVRDNICPSATLECGTRNRTMHGRYHGNFIEKSLVFGNDKSETNWFINISEPIGPETSTPEARFPFSLNVSLTGHFRGATIRNAKMQPGVTRFDHCVLTNCHLVLSGTKDGRFEDCVFRNCYWQYSMTNVFTRCAFIDGTCASGMTGHGSTTMTDCVFTNFYLGSGYWTLPYDLTMSRCSVKNTISDHFWSVGVYSIGNFSISDCVFDTAGVAPFHIFDLRAQNTDGESARVAVKTSESVSSSFISKAGGTVTTQKHVAFSSRQNTVGGEPVEEASAFMCPLLEGFWTCDLLGPEGKDITYVGPDGGDWNEPANWDPAGLPQPLDSVFIPRNRVIAGDSVICSNITVGAEGGFFLGSTGAVSSAFSSLSGAPSRRALRLDVAGNIVCNGEMALGGRWFPDAEAVITNLSVTVGGDFVLADGATCSVNANTTDNPVTWPNLWAAAAHVDVAGDIRITGGSVLYPTCDRLSGATVRFRCRDFLLDEASSVNAQNRGWGWITYTSNGQIDPRNTKKGTYGGVSRFTLAPNSLGISDWGGGASYAFTNRFAPFAPGTQSAAYHTPSDGGGQFTLWASGVATLGGVIRADGVHNAYSANSGGGIWLAARRFAVADGAKLIATGGKNTHGSGKAGAGGAVSIAVGLSDTELEALAAGCAPADLGLASLGEINEIDCDVSGGLNGFKDVNGFATYALPGTATAVYGASAALPVMVRSSSEEMGTPDPGYGLTVCERGAERTFSCTGAGFDPSDPANVRYRCVGYVISNATAEVARGVANTVSLTVADEPLFLYWGWGEREVRLPVTVPGHASVELNGEPVDVAAGVWMSEDVSAVVKIIPDTGYEFLGWEGEVPCGMAFENPVTLPAGSVRRISPVIREISAPATRRWKGGTKAWTVASNWEPAGVPGFADAIEIATGTCLVSNFFRCASLTLSGGALKVGTLATPLLEEVVVRIDGDVLMSGSATLDVSAKSNTRGGVLDVAGDLTLSGANTLTVCAGPTNGVDRTFAAGTGSVTVGGDFAVGGTSIVKPVSSPWTGGSVVFTVAGDFRLAAGAKFTATELGWAREPTLVPNTFCPGAGSSYMIGGGYGGCGWGANATYGKTYGFANAPIHPGAPKGGYYFERAGAGLVRIHADRVLLDGGIDCSSADSWPSAPSGGGIWITGRRKLALGQTATLTVKGGAKTNYTSEGGGGRIALGVGLEDADIRELSATGELARLDDSRICGLDVFTNTLYKGVSIDLRCGRGTMDGIHSGTFRFLDGRPRGIFIMVR